MISHVFILILFVSYSTSCPARATGNGKSHDGFYAIWGESVILPEKPLIKLQRVFSNANTCIRFIFLEAQCLMKAPNPPNEIFLYEDGGLKWLRLFQRVFKCFGVCAKGWGEWG